MHTTTIKGEHTTWLLRYSLVTGSAHAQLLHKPIVHLLQLHTRPAKKDPRMTHGVINQAASIAADLRGTNLRALWAPFQNQLWLLALLYNTTLLPHQFLTALTSSSTPCS
jgi:hypothetical protein